MDGAATGSSPVRPARRRRPANAGRRVHDREDGASEGAVDARHQSDPRRPRTVPQRPRSRNLADAVDALLAADERRRTLIGSVEALRTAQNKRVEGDRRRAGRREADADRRGQQGLRRAQGEGAGAGGRRGRAHRAARRTPEHPARERARRLHRRGRARGAPSRRAADVRLRAARPRGAGRAARRARHRTWRAHERVALRLPARRHRVRAVRAGAARPGYPCGEGLHAGRYHPCWSARRRCTARGSCPPTKRSST